MEPGSSSVRPSNPSDSDSIPVNSRESGNVYSVPHLQMGGSGLDIFPRPNSPTIKKLMQRQGEWWICIMFKMLKVCSAVLYELNYDMYFRGLRYLGKGLHRAKLIFIFLWSFAVFSFKWKVVSMLLLCVYLGIALKMYHMSSFLVIVFRSFIFLSPTWNTPFGVSVITHN